MQSVPEIKQTELVINDDVMRALRPLMTECANKIKQAKLTRRKVMIRFHNDADGIVGGLAIQNCLKSAFNTQNNSVFYKPEYALRDISLIAEYNNPLLIIIDFGSSIESKEGLNLIKGAGIETILIDHHPTSIKPNVDLYISPFLVGGDSFYPAGYIACEIAKLVRPVDSQYLDLIAKISLTGDKSSHYVPTFEDKRKALVLDYLATYSRFPNSLKLYKKVLDDRELFYSIVLQSEEKIEEIKQVADKYTKIKNKGDYKIVLLQLDKLVKKFEFPSKSKAVGTVFDVYDSKEPLIVIGHGEKLITIRVNKQALDLGFSARDAILELKMKMVDSIESGGGHDGAASMRCYEGHTFIVLDELVNMIE